MMVALIVPALLITYLGVCYWFIPLGNGERSGFLATIILTEVMFLVMLTAFVPLSKRIPILAYLFLGYVALLVLMSGLVVCLEARVLRMREMLDDIKSGKIA
jgi:hypothetical protein